MLREYWRYDGLAQAALVRAGEVSARELVESAIEAGAQLNPLINAICHDLADRALAAAGSVSRDAPFAGVPFLLKDVGAQMKGTPYECGSRLMQGHVSGYSTTLAERFEQAGLISIGKTTTPEFGAQITTEAVLTGVTRNPWNALATPGGSSGGSAAAVAAGIVAVAHANDGLGSIRIPAANCGLFGLKPTRQRTPAGPVASEVSGGRGVEFVVSRTVRDSAALLDAVHGPDVGAPHWAPPLARPYSEELAGPRRPLRMALMERTFTGRNVHPDCAKSVRLLAATCADLGHAVEQITPEVDWDAYTWAIRAAGSASFAAGVEGAARAVGRVPSERNLEPLTWLSYLEGRRLSAADYFKALDTFARLQRSLGVFFERYDVLITPMLTRPPADIGWLGQPATLGSFWDKFAGDAYSPFAGIFNVTGQPAASIPCLVTHDARPVGVQIVARFGDEATLLGLAAQIEEARPWRDQLPSVHVTNTTAAGAFARAASHRS